LSFNNLLNNNLYLKNEFIFILNILSKILIIWSFNKIKFIKIYFTFIYQNNIIYIYIYIYINTNLLYYHIQNYLSKELFHYFIYLLFVTSQF